MFTEGNWEPDFHEYKQKPKKIYTGIRVELEPNYYRRLFDTILPETDKEYCKEHDEIEANVKLVCAAPKMLSVLKDLIAEYESKGHLLNFDVNKAREAVNEAVW